MDRTYYANANGDEPEHADAEAGGPRPAEDRRSGIDRRRQDRRADDRARKARLTPQEIAALLHGSR